MPSKDYHKVLDLSYGATEKQIKVAYRKLALRYHPDHNDEPKAKQKFQEIKAAYEYLMTHQGDDDHLAREVIRRERERMHHFTRIRQEKKKKEKEYFDRPEWHDPILFLKYTIHIFALIFAFSAVIFPVILAFFYDPASLAGTFYFLAIGIFLLVYLYRRRSTWFKLGKFKLKWKDVVHFIKMDISHLSTDQCCYARNQKANGKSYKIELLKTLDIRIRSYGALNHEARYKNRIKRVVIPRSIRAQWFHRVSSLLKIAAIVTCLVLFPVESMLWRFFAGILAGWILSGLLLGIGRIKSKVSYLLTPGLIMKLLIWLFALYKISVVGPGFNIRLTGSVYIMVVGLLFLLDMLFDLIMGFFPFYHRLFRPLVRQGKILNALYREGYQNYQELPVYSVLFPLYKWLF